MTDMATTDAAAQQAAAQGEPSQTEAAQQQQAAEAPPDPRVMGRLDELTDMFQSFAPALEQIAQGQQQEEQDPFAEFGDEFTQGLGEHFGLDPQQALDAFRQIAQAEAQRMVGAQIAPIQEQLRNQAFQELEARYPDLQDEGKAAAALDSAERYAQQFAQAMGLPPQVAAAMALAPEFVELVYKAGVADQHARSQSERGEQQEVQLEAGGAAAPAGDEPSLADRIVNAPGGASPNGFRFW